MRTWGAALGGAMLGSAVTASLLWGARAVTDTPSASASQGARAESSTAAPAQAGSTPRTDAAREVSALDRTAKSAREAGAGDRKELVSSAYLERLTQQNADLAAEVARLQERLERSDEGSGRSKVYGLGEAELKELAARCELRWDMPSVRTDRAPTVSDEDASALGWDDEQARAADAAFEAYNRKTLEKLRVLYSAATGEANASTVSAETMISEITDKAGPGELARAFQQLAAERAGLSAAAPADEERTIVEQLYRFMIGAGDDFEHLLARRIGAEQARALRALHGGFSSKAISSHGCP